MNVMALLEEMIARNAFDLHLVDGQPPVFRSSEGLARSEGAGIQEADIQTFVSTHLSEEQRARLQQGYDVSLPIRHAGRLFQCYVLRGGGKLALSARLIASHVPALEELRFGTDVMQTLKALMQKPRGLLLVTGETGSGKQTLCAALLETVNRDRVARIWTLEEPLGYEMTSRQSLVTQRLVGRDVASFEAGLQSAAHADVDIVYISELRSLEAVQLALTLAETGRLVMAVLGVGSVSEAIQRLGDVFGAQGETIRRLLSQTLIGVVAQRLLPTQGGRMPAVEILLNTPAVKPLIRDGQADLTPIMEAGRGQGMQTMDDAVFAAYQGGYISEETARAQMGNPERLGGQG